MRISLSGGAFQSTAHNFRQQVFSRAFRRRSACDGGGSGADAGLVRGPHRPASLPHAYPFRIDPFFLEKGYEPIGRDGPAPLGVENGRLPDIKDSRRFRPRLACGGLKNGRYCDSKFLCGGKPYGAGVSDMALSGVAGWRLPKAIAGS